MRMKNFFKFFALAAFVLVAGVSCQDPKVDTDPAVLTVGEVILCFKTTLIYFMI